MRACPTRASSRRTRRASAWSARSTCPPRARRPGPRCGSWCRRATGRRRPACLPRWRASTGAPRWPSSTGPEHWEPARRALERLRRSWAARRPDFLAGQGSTRGGGRRRCADRGPPVRRVEYQLLGEATLQTLRAANETLVEVPSAEPAPRRRGAARADAGSGAAEAATGTALPASSNGAGPPPGEHAAADSHATAAPADSLGAAPGAHAGDGGAPAPVGLPAEDAMTAAEAVRLALEQSDQDAGSVPRSPVFPTFSAGEGSPVRPAGAARPALCAQGGRADARPPGARAGARAERGRIAHAAQQPGRQLHRRRRRARGRLCRARGGLGRPGALVRRSWRGRAVGRRERRGPARGRCGRARAPAGRHRRAGPRGRRGGEL